MIEDVLKNVRAAEEKAALITGEAEAKAQELRATADRRAEELIASAKKNAKAERNNSLTRAAAAAESAAAQSADAVRAECLALKTRLDPEAESISAEIFRRLKDGDR